MDQSVRYTIWFRRPEAGDTGHAAESLRRSLQEVDPTIGARRVRHDAEAMDFGTGLAVVLSAASVVELAKGIANWLARTRSSKVTVTRSDGSIVVENISARDAVALAQKLSADNHGSQ